jgi:hypothetical protein
MDMNMLRRALWGFLRPLLQLVTNLLNPEIGEEWTSEFKKFLRKEECWVVASRLLINRGCFIATEFLGQGWSVVPSETDARSLALSELNLTKVRLVTEICDGERLLGEDNLKRLRKPNYIHLDADIFLTLWRNQHLIPESWKKKFNGNTRYIFFNGMILLAPDKGRYLLFLWWEDDQWHFDLGWLSRTWGADCVSAVLETTSLKRSS